MKALEHLRTINHHKMLVMKQCFQVGLYKPVSYTHLLTLATRFENKMAAGQ